MPLRYELFVALRYLAAPRKEVAISAVTLISVLGVAAGVAALVIAVAINTGFRNTLQRNLLSGTAHVTLAEKVPSTGISDWREMAKRLAAVPGVTQATPALFGFVFFKGPRQSAGGYVKGILGPEKAVPPSPLLALQSGEFKDWEPRRGLPTIILGRHLAQNIGIRADDVVTLISPQGELGPEGPRIVEYQFRVIGLFESGFFDLDNTFAFASLESVQRVLSLTDVVNAVELQVNDIYRAPEIGAAAEAVAGPEIAALPWMEQNRQLLSALETEKRVTIITIGLIQLVAALNILTSLVMIVMEKYRDIGVLISMGARREQVRRIFMLQGLIIGVTGTVIGLLAGYTLSYLANRGKWIPLEESVYSMNFVPFEPRFIDAAWISATALLVSLMATLYPARNASRVAPAVALRNQ